MQFIETARRLELHAFSVCTKAPKRYAPLLTNRIFELASTVHEEVRAANNIYPHNQHEAQMRRDHLINANIALQNLSPKLTLLYDAILQNPEKCPWIDHAMKEFGEYITDEAQLISKVRKAHLYLSGKKCCKGVYWKNSTQRYIGNIIPIIAKTHRELQNGTFKHRGFHAFTIMERGKKRYIRSVHITERAVQKCLCDYCLVPIYSACFIYDNSASLKHRGMDFALRRMTCYLQRHYRKYGLEGGVLLYDFHSFFDSAPHEPLFREADRRLHDPKIRELANSFITDFGSVGLGLGSQVSQTNALMLPNMIDHYFKEVCRIKAYERYMDDGVAISPDIDDLYLCMDGLKIICEKCGLELNLKKTRVIPLRDYYRWLKTRFIITPTGKVVRKMNKDSTKIVRHKLRAFRGKLDRGEMTLADIRCSIDSYNGHMKRGHSFKVRQRTNQYFKSLYGFYPDEKGWKSHV